MLVGVATFPGMKDAYDQLDQIFRVSTPKTKSVFLLSFFLSFFYFSFFSFFVQFFKIKMKCYGKFSEICYLLIEVVDTVVYVNEQRMSRSDCTDVHTHLDLRCSHIA